MWGQSSYQVSRRMETSAPRYPTFAHPSLQVSDSHAVAARPNLVQYYWSLRWPARHSPPTAARDRM